MKTILDLNGTSVLKSDEENGVTGVAGGMSADERLQNLLKNREVLAKDSAYQATDVNTGGSLSIENPEDFSAAIMSGGYTPDAAETFSVITPDGRIGKVSAANIKEVLESGAAKLESKQAQLDREDEKKYGDSNFAAFSAGAARGFTVIPVSDMAAAAMGKGDEMRGLENANPVASIAGEVLGTAAGLFTGSAEAGATVKGLSFLAKLGGQQLVDKAGEKAASYVTKQLIKEGVREAASKSLAKRILYKGVEATAEGAILGASQGVSRLLTENSFGTAELNAENLVSYAGMGSLVGGAFGSAIGITKALVPSVKGVAKEGLDSALNAVNDKDAAVMNLAGLSGSQVAKEVKYNKTFLEDGAEFMKDAFKGRDVKDEAGVYEALFEHRKSVGKEIGETGKQIDHNVFTKGGKNEFVNAREFYEEVKNKFLKAREEAAKSLDPAYLKKFDSQLELLDEKIAAHQSIDSIKKVALDTADKMEAKGVSKESADVLRNTFEYAKDSKTLKDVLGNLKESYIGNKEMMGALDSIETKLNKMDESASEVLTWKDLQDMRKPHVDMISSFKKSMEDHTVNELFHRTILNEIKQHQEGLALKAGLLEKYLPLKKAYMTSESLVMNSEKLMYRESKKAASGPGMYSVFAAHDLAQGSLGVAAVKLVKDFIMSTRYRKAVIMGSMENATKFTEGAISNFAKGLGKGIEKTVESAEPVAVKHLTSSFLTADLSGDKPKKAKDEHEAYANLQNNARQAVENPEVALERIRKQTRMIEQEAPETSAAIAAHYLKTMQYLNGHINKKSAKQTGLFDALKQAKKSTTEIAKIQRIVSAVENPHNILKLAAKGQLSREHADVLQNVYPEIFKKLQEQTMKELYKPNKKFTYQEKLNIGLLLNIPADESMHAQSIQGLQMQYSSEQPQGDVGPKAKITAPSKNVQTATGRIESPE